MFTGGDAGPSPQRYSQVGGGYYGSQQRESYSQQRPRGYSSRMQSEPQMYAGRPYPQHSYHQSGDTVNTGMTHGSDSTGPWANSTDPSSENSSIDRNIAMQNNGYGYNPTIMEDQAYGEYAQDGYGGSPQMPQQARYNNGGPVQQPPPARRPIPLGNSGGGSYQEPHQGGSLPSASKSRPQEEKRKSWLKRRFSKKD